MTARPDSLAILSIIDARVITGPVRGLIHLARALPDHAMLHVAALCRDEQTPLPPIAQSARDARLVVHRLVEGSSYDPTVILRARELATRVHADVIQSHSYKPHVIAAGMRALDDAPWIGWHHGWTAENLKVKLFHAVDRVTLPRADRIVAVSTHSEKLVLGIGAPRERTVRIANAVDARDLEVGLARDDARAQLGLPTDATIVSAIGRLSHEKGQDVFIEAFARIAAQLPNTHLALAGDGPDREALGALVAKHGLTARVHFLGHQKAVGVVYAASDLMVLPSRSEGMPNALLEAMCVGTPSIATNVGGVTEVADDGTSAWIVPPQDPGAMADAIASAVRDPAERQRRADAARHRIARDFAPVPRARKILALYDTLLGTSHATRLDHNAEQFLHTDRECLRPAVNPTTVLKTVANLGLRAAVAPLVAAYRAECAVMPASRRQTVFQAWSQVLSAVPGYTGQYLRRAFYGAVLTGCHTDSCINWGTVFSTPDATIEQGVYVGARCMLGRVHLARNVTIGSNVDILSGRRQHNFDDLETPIQQQGGAYDLVTLGEDCWIGNGAVIMADVGARAIVAAGSVVVKPVPAEAIVGGNPSRLIKSRRDGARVERPS